MIKPDKRKYSICIVSKSPKDCHYKHLDPLKHYEKDPDNSCIGRLTGQEKALHEAQKLANKLGKKVTVLTSSYNVYPDEVV